MPGRESVGIVGHRQPPSSSVQRRTFVTVLATTAFWPRAARAQPAAGVAAKTRRIGVLLGQSETTRNAQARFAVFKQSLAALGWVEGKNLQMDVRWTGGDINRAAALAKELVALQPEVITSSTTAATAALQRETKTIPIVFVAVSDPVGSGLVKSLAQPSGNVTGFVDLEPSLIEKCLELLTELAPRVTRVGIMFNPDTAPYANVYLQRLQTVSPRVRAKTFAASVRNEADIEKTIAGLGQESGGLVVMPDSFMGVHHRATIAIAARHKVPATYFAEPWVLSGGLSSYGPDVEDLRRRAADYVDRILKGAKPADLPVQQPTKFELALNLNTARALGLSVPQAVLLRADTVIQ